MNGGLTAWLRASAYTCRFPTDLVISSFNVWTTALPIILLITSPTPTGRSPGFCPRVRVCWLKMLQGSRFDLILHTASMQHWSGPYICWWRSDQNYWMWVFSSNHRHPYLKALTHLLCVEWYFERLQHLCIYTLSYVWILVYRRIKTVYQAHFDMGVFASKG